MIYASSGFETGRLTTLKSPPIFKIVFRITFSTFISLILRLPAYLAFLADIFLFHHLFFRTTTKRLSSQCN